LAEPGTACNLIAVEGFPPPTPAPFGSSRTPAHETRNDMSQAGGQDHHLRTDHLHGDLNRRAIRGGAVTLASQGIKVAVQFLTIVVLARLLAPEDFGRFAMVAAFLVVFELFKDLGLSTATVQRGSLSGGQVSTLFWLNAGLGIVMAAAFAALAPVLPRLYGEP